MSKQLTKVTLVAVIDGVEYSLGEEINLALSDKFTPTHILKKSAEALAAHLAMEEELRGNFPRTDASKYKLTEDGKVVERPDSDYKKS